MEWFTLVLTLIGLGVGGHYFVVSAGAIGQRCGMGPALVGATIVAIGTSLPEWGVSVTAAWYGLGDLSVGNIVGSNICNVCLILGLAAMIAPIPASRISLRRDTVLMLVATFLLLACCAGGTIGRLEGMLLLGLGIGTTVFFVATRREDMPVDNDFRWWDVPRAAVALGVVLGSSSLFVGAAEVVARRWGVSEWTIGITVAAIGTSLPELVTSLAAAWRKQTAMLVGNILGSNTLNILFVLGSAASIRSLSSANFTLVQAGLFTGLMLLAALFLWSSKKVTRWEGAILFIAGSAWYVADTLAYRG